VGVNGFDIEHVAVTQAWEDVIEFLILVLEIFEYLVLGGALRENLYRTPGRNDVRPSHPARYY